MTRKGQCGQTESVAYYYRAGYRDWRFTLFHGDGTVEDVAQATSLKKLWPHASRVRAVYGARIEDGRLLLKEGAK